MKRLTAVFIVSLIITACGGSSDDEQDIKSPAPAPGPVATVPTTKMAPLVLPTCALYSADKRLQDQPDGYAIVTNRCSVPIALYGCWVSKGAENCQSTPEKWYETDVAQPGRSVFFPGPGPNDQRLAAYLVCDMSNPELTCGAKSPIEGATSYSTLSDSVLDINGPGAVGTSPPTGNPPPNSGSDNDQSSGSTTPIPDNMSATRGFINWNGSDNGDVVLDSNNEEFKFFSDTKCIYSLNRKEETSNFCLINNSANANFAGRSVSVTKIRSNTGGCIVGLVDPTTNRMIDIYTNGIQYFRVSDVTPNFC